ncbi:hypothetical protein PHMEG_00025464 [Phytophthora megakarya]|uniref:Polyprotein n=1 Tax=Phytophthora megakarya TaxID=4795 RepID=A0A225VDE8_9STRA|nr:hypothetical protein PHMEG_00025464 [Phytophthora megakarya]
MKFTSDKNFTGKHYAPWKPYIKVMLQAKQLPLPPPRGAGLGEEEYFRTREHEAATYLMTTLSDDVVVSHLEGTYEPRNWGNLCSLQNQFVRIKYKEGTDTLIHVTEHKVLAGQLANQSKAVDDAEKVCHQLSSLLSS